MKKCSRCQETKPFTDFPSSGYTTRRDGTKQKTHKPQCKPCYVVMQREQYYALWDKYFEAKCSRCGYDKCRAALDLHHVNGEKDFTFAARWSVSEQRFAEEAAKCIVLCANCHREVHNE